MKPKFTICVITKNEEKTLPRLLESLNDFKKRGGEIVIVDTGSSDTTAQIAKDFGCVVEEVGTKFIKTITKEKAEEINGFFIVEGEEPVVKEGNKFFDFSEARNYCASLASNNMISCADADEVFTKLDIDKINSLIEGGHEQFEYNFVYAHDKYGNEAIKFVQSKMYDRRKVKWTNMVHEVLQGDAKRMFLDESIFKLEHFQIPAEHRSSYLAGLALDCYLHLDYDRNSHYFARELMWCGRPKSAIKEFQRHIAMNRWKTEQAQSYIFMGDCYRMLGNREKQLECYNKSIFVEAERREAFIKIARYYREINNPKMVAAYVTAALELPWFPFYANNKAHYTYEPHELLYWARGWQGRIPEARHHLTEALRYQPDNKEYLRDTKFYFDYPNQDIEGWMSFEECQWLYYNAKNYNTIIEVGSWKGRSTHALLSGTKGIVHAVDHFKGSADPQDEAKGDTFDIFMKNVGHFENLKVHRNNSVDGSKEFENKSAEMIFIDAGHTYEEVLEDIKHWLPKCTKLFCGHDYGWPGVQKAVNEIFGKPDKVTGSIWQVDLTNRGIARELAQKITNQENFSFVKRGDGEEECMSSKIGQNCDNIQYNVQLANHLKDAFEFFSTKENIIVPKFENQALYNSLLHHANNDYLGAEIFYKSIIESARKKVYLGPKRLQVVANLLGAKHIICPDILDISNYQEISDKVLHEIEENAIFMFSAGLYAKVMIAEVLKSNPNVTCLDIGSAFDALVKNSRIGQLLTNDLWNLYLPKVSIIVPQLGRQEGLQRLLTSIDNLQYPQHKIQRVIVEGDETVPKKVALGLEQSNGEYIVYAANDMEFLPDSLRNAIIDSITYDKGLVSFDTGVRNEKNYICEHFVIKKSLIEKIDREIFDTEFHHVGVDDLLWAKCTKLNQSMMSKAKVLHYHFSRKGNEHLYDDIVEKGWKNRAQDRELLAKKLEAL